jgi:hypothetical protein
MIEARAELWWNAGALHVGGTSSQLLWSVRVEEILRRILLLLQLPRNGRNGNVSGQEQRIASENRESVAFSALSFCSCVEHRAFLMLSIWLYLRLVLLLLLQLFPAFCNSILLFFSRLLLVYHSFFHPKGSILMRVFLLHFLVYEVYGQSKAIFFPVLFVVK